jgi:hypothetical protein
LAIVVTRVNDVCLPLVVSMRYLPHLSLGASAVVKSSAVVMWRAGLSLFWAYWDFGIELYLSGAV